MKKALKIAGIAIGVLLLLAILFFWLVTRPLIKSPESVPTMVTALPMDFDHIYAISRFRSGAGHDHSYGEPNGETCRSMKHYFNISRTEENSKTVRSVPGPGESNLNIYAPFDGLVVNNDGGGDLGRELIIRSAKYPSYRVRLGHIDPLPSMKIGTKVKSGQLVGTVGPRDGFDYLMEATILPLATYYVSMFDVVTDEAFKPFADKGYLREDFIISKEYRDTHPLQCNKEAFVRDMQFWHEDYLWLTEDPFPRPGETRANTHIGPPKR